MELTEKQKETILENVKEHLLEEDQHLAPNALKRIWLLREEYGEFILTNPVLKNGERCMQFDPETLEWVGIQPLDYVQQYGELL